MPCRKPGGTRRVTPYVPTGPSPPSPGRFLLPPRPAVCPRRPVPTVSGACSAAAGPRRTPPPAHNHHLRGGLCCRGAPPYAPPARPHRPRGGFCCRRAPPYALAGSQPTSSGRFLLPSCPAVRPHRPASPVLGAAPYVPSGRKPGQMLKWERPDLDFAEKCSIFAKQRRKSYTTGGFLLF